MAICRQQGIFILIYFYFCSQVSVFSPFCATCAYRFTYVYGKMISHVWLQVKVRQFNKCAFKTNNNRRSYEHNSPMPWRSERMYREIEEITYRNIFVKHAKNDEKPGCKRKWERHYNETKKKKKVIGTVLVMLSREREGRRVSTYVMGDLLLYHVL